MHRWKGVLRCIAGAACVAAFFALALRWGPKDDPAPGTVRLSHGSGFYDEGFDLAMEADGGEIRYTLDSTQPDGDSLLYTGPIHIEDVSGADNLYSARTDVALDLNVELLESLGKKAKYGFKLPKGPVDKATVVRAVCIDRFGNRSPETQGVYFVGYGDKPAYDGINIITITTEPKNLFDSETGIYVLGDGFQSALDNGELDPDTEYHFWPANYRNKGAAWEREASICFFDSNRKPLASGNYGIRVQGNSSRARLPKSFNIYVRERYGSGSLPGLELFGEDLELTRLNLNTGANGMDTLLTDYLVNKLAADLNYETRPYRPYALFLDGEYWGMYWLTPRYTADFFKGRLGLEEDEVIEVKWDGIEVGSTEDYEVYQSMRTFIADNDMSDPEMYAKACELIDIASCIDYYAMEFYIANSDWPYNNCALWRTRETGSEAPRDGRWRWLEYDVNMAMNPRYAKTDMLQRAAGRDAMFSSLLENDGFEAALTAKLVELAQSNFRPDLVDAFVEDYIRMMGDAMANDYERFYGGDLTRQDFEDKCRNIAGFFQKRYDYIIEHYGE